MTIATGCRESVGADGSGAPSSGSETTAPTGEETATGSGSSESSTTGDLPLEICTEGPNPVWCFERRELPGPLPVDLDQDGLADSVDIEGDGDSLISLSGYLNVGDAMPQRAWEIELPFGSPLIEPLATPMGPRMLVGSTNEVNTPLVVVTMDGASAQVEAEFPLDHNWNFGGYALLDANNDEITDIFVVAAGAARMWPLFGMSNGGYAPQPVLELDDAVFGSSGWAVGDVDGDDNIDLLTGRSGAGSPTVFFGDGSGGFADIVDIPADGRWPAHVVDVDGDGDGDVLTATAFGFAVAYTEPGRTFRVVEQGIGEGPLYNTDGFFFIPADLDHDGSVEIVGFQDDMVSMDGAPDYGAHYVARLHVYSDIGQDGFATDRSVVFEESCDSHSESFMPTDRAVELDGDGEPDFVFWWTTFCPEDFTRTNLGLMYRPQ